MRPAKAVPWIDCLTCGQRVAPAVYVHHKLFHLRRAAVRRPRLSHYWYMVLALALVVPWFVGVFTILWWCVERW